MKTWTVLALTLALFGLSACSTPDTDPGTEMVPALTWEQFLCRTAVAHCLKRFGSRADSKCEVSGSFREWSARNRTMIEGSSYITDFVNRLKTKEPTDDIVVVTISPKERHRVLGGTYYVFINKRTQAVVDSFGTK